MKHRLITTSSFFDEEGNLLNQLFDLGLPCLHIRKPGATLQQIQSLLGTIHQNFHSRIIIYSEYLSLLERYDLRGIHWRESDRIKQTDLAAQLSDLSSYDKGTSIHDPKDLESLCSAFNYTFVSPVFDSISKKGYTARIDWNINEWPHSVHPIALGGIHHNNIHIAKQKGFEEVAFLGAIWTDLSQVISNYNKICNTINDLML